MTSSSKAKTTDTPSKPISSAKMIPNQSKLKRNLRDLAFDIIQCPPEADFIEDLTSDDPVLQQKAQEQVEMCLVGAEEFDENADQLLNMVSWFRNRAQFRIDESRRIRALSERDTKTANQLEQYVYTMFQHVYGEQGFSEMWNDFLSSASPILKTPIEWGMGRQAFNDRAIGDADLGEKTIVEHMVDQIGYYASFKGLSKAFMRDGMEGILYQLMIRGRFQPLDIDKLQAQISIEKNEEIKKLRRSINNAVRNGDEEQAMRIAERIIEPYRVMYFSGLKHRVPSALHGRFTREEVGMKREGITPPGANIPQQQPFN